MTRKEIEKILAGLRYGNIVKIKSKEGTRIFLLFIGLKGEEKLRFWGSNAAYWVYSPNNSYLYREDVGDVPQNVYFQKIDIAKIKIMDPASLVTFLNALSEHFKEDQFFKFLFS